MRPLRARRPRLVELRTAEGTPFHELNEGSERRRQLQHPVSRLSRNQRDVFPPFPRRARVPLELLKADRALHQHFIVRLRRRRTKRRARAVRAAIAGPVPNRRRSELVLRHGMPAFANQLADRTHQRPHKRGRCPCSTSTATRIANASANTQESRCRAPITTRAATTRNHGTNAVTPAESTGVAAH